MVQELETTVKTENEVKVRHAYDYSLLFLTIFLVGLGLVFVYSSSSYTAIKFEKYEHDPVYFLRKQLLAAGVGIVAMLIVSRINYNVYKEPYTRKKIRLIYFLYVICIGLQLLVYSSLGENINGKSRWIRIDPIGTLQPSEVSKICLIVLTAFIVSIAPKAQSTLWGYIKTIIYAAPLIVLVAIEDLSTSIVMAGIVFVSCFIASTKVWQYIVSAVLAIAAVFVYIMRGDGFRSVRIVAWLNVETDENAEQIRNGLYAISSGGLTGKGLGQSSMKLGFVPEAYNDMIFSIICEEIGLIGAVAIILLFLLILWRIAVVACNAPDLFGTFLCIGVMSHIAIQLIMNIMVVTSLLPATGIALPFISYGGTSLVLLLCEIGMVLSVSYRIEIK